MPDVVSPVAPDESDAFHSACACRTRRSLLATALVAGTCFAIRGTAGAQEGQAGSDDRPQTGDLLVISEGPQAGQLIKPSDLTLGEPPLHAWPKDSKTSVVRDGSRLNEILIIKLDPAELDDETRGRSAGGIVAYSAVCTHAGCSVTAWMKGEGSDKDVLKCMCHNSEYDPRESAQVVFGPAPRRLAALPLAIAGDLLAIAAPFAGKVGVQQSP